MIPGLRSLNFLATSDYVLNPVNCVGTMGKGLAKKFKERNPGIMLPYIRACSRGELTLDTWLPYHLSNQTIINFPTKMRWNIATDRERMLRTLTKFLESLPDGCTVAMPLLGCGEGSVDTVDFIDGLIDICEQYPQRDVQISLYVK